ncbi:MAG: ribosome assembly factor SBDS, partial [archaeon]
MTNTLARIKQAGKNFEMIVDMDEALKFKKGEVDFIEAEGDKIFTDSKKGFVASNSDLQSAFGTTDVNEIVSKIVKSGEVQTTQEQRSSEQEQKFKQVVNFIVTNAVDPQTGNPHTAERIRNALKEAHVNVKNAPIENQIKEIISEVGKIIPIKIETKKVKITVPAIHTGKVYGVINQ